MSWGHGDVLNAINLLSIYLWTAVFFLIAFYDKFISVKVIIDV